MSYFRGVTKKTIVMEKLRDDEPMIQTGSERRRRVYSAPAIECIAISFAMPLLAASVANVSVINSVGQELGPRYDLSAEDGIDFNTSKTFTHEWDD